MQFTDQTILVTGGAGFIGSHLVEHLIEQGLAVRVLDNFRNGKRSNLAGVKDPSRLQIIQGDVTDATTCLRACKDVGLVFHLACLGVRHSLHNPMENHHVNAFGTLNILEAAKSSNVKRLVYVSTSEVYGRATDFPIRETTTTWPLTVYGASKLSGELYARTYFESFGLSTVCVRPFNNYGPRSHFQGDTGEVIPRFIVRALTDQPPIIFGEGWQTRDFLYVGDCAEALLKIAGCDILIGQVVNLGYGEEVRVDKLAELILQAVGKTHLKPIHEAERPADVPRLWVDTNKLRGAIKFHPRTSMFKGLEKTIGYFQQLLAEDPKSVEQMTTRNWEV